MKKLFAVIAVCFLAIGCTSLSPNAEDTGSGGEETDEIVMNANDAAMSSGSLLVVFSASFMDPFGSLYTIDKDATEAGALELATDSSDSVLRSFGGFLYVVNRGTASIQAIDQNDLSLVADYSVGLGSNPQDISVVSSGKAYVSRLDAQNDAENSDDVLVINPTTGALLKSIDLTPYTDEGTDQLARAAQMVVVGNKLLVLMQQLSYDYVAPVPGKIAVIDIDSDEVRNTIDLVGWNPSEITYCPKTGLVYVAQTGKMVNFTVDISDATGGIEAVDLGNMASQGIIIDDADFGGDVRELRLASDTLAFTIVSSKSVATFDPVAHEVTNAAIYNSTSSYPYLADIAVDGQGRLIIAETDAANPGVVFVNTQTGAIEKGPISVGNPPSSFAFITPREGE